VDQVHEIGLQIHRRRGGYNHLKDIFWGLMKEVSGFLAFAQEGFDRVFTVALPKNQIQEEK
jgi:hypothetical protein